jgi:hypothetical protein
MSLPLSGGGRFSCIAGLEDSEDEIQSRRNQLPAGAFFSLSVRDSVPVAKTADISGTLKEEAT